MMIPEFTTPNELAAWRGQPVTPRQWEIWHGRGCTPETTEGMRRMFAGEALMPPAARPRGFTERIDRLLNRKECKHRGVETRRELCPSCNGRAEVFIFGCEVHGECHLSNKNLPSGAKSCLTCNEVRLKSPKIASWAVGVTTAGRRGTLQGTLDDLKAAGWPDVTVFAEPDSDAPATALRSGNQLGAWPNRFRAIKWLLENTQAEALLICEDDIRVALLARAWADTAGFPSERCGMLGFYRHSGQPVKEKRGGIETERWRPADEVCGPLDERGFQLVTGNLWGSCMLAFPRHAAELLVADGIINLEFPHKPDRFSDLRLRHWLSRVGMEYWVANPSWCQHRTDVPSILGHGNGEGMSSDTFVGSASDATSELWPV